MQWMSRGLVYALIAIVGCTRVAAGQDERPDVLRGLELEGNGKLREAAVVFRGALSSGSPNALLGLERVYADLGMSDSLLAPLDSLIAQRPKETLFRSVQLRTLQILRRDERLRSAFESWVRAVPRDPAPYREYARILIQLGRPATADSIIVRGKQALGSLRDLEYENAQLRAAMGEWIPSAQAWRRALGDAPHLANAAAFALAPAPEPSREGIRAALGGLPVEAGARKALAELELTWGRPREAWEALRSLRPDTGTAAVWEEFGERAYADERWSIAHDALVGALSIRRNSSLAVRAGNAAIHAGAPAEVFTIAPLAELSRDSALVARQYVPLHVQAFVALNRAADAEALVARFDRFIVPAQRMRLAQLVANSYVRNGDLAHARASLRAAGPEADSSEAAGLIALYEGHLATARTLLRNPASPTPDVTLALGIIARSRTDEAPQLGAAFLALARNDTTAAIARFVEAAAEQPAVAAPLWLEAARLQLAARPGAAVPMWQRIVTQYSGSPEAVEAELEWARALRRGGDSAGAVLHLEHLILGAPQSALLPQARRELEQLRGTVPPHS